MAERGSRLQRELVTVLSNRIPGLLFPGTTFEALIRAANDVVRNDRPQSLPDYFLTTPDGSSLHIRLLEKISHKLGEIPLSHLIQMTIDIPDTPSIFAFYKGNIGLGYFVDESSELFIARSIGGGRATNQGLVLDFDKQVAQVVGYDGGATLQPWGFEEKPPDEIKLQNDPRYLGRSLVLRDFQGLGDIDSRTMGFLLQGDDKTSTAPIVLPKKLSVVK